MSVFLSDTHTGKSDFYDDVIMAKVMIIDDSDDTRSHLKELLLSNNHDVVYETNNGSEATKRYFMIKPEILFLDLVSSDGLTVLKKIHQKKSDM